MLRREHVFFCFTYNPLKFDEKFLYNHAEHLNSIFEKLFVKFSKLNNVDFEH